MSMLVDYRCTDCGGREERWVPSPPPAAATCTACGARSRRLFAAVGLSRDPAGAGSVDAASGPAKGSATARKPSMCQQFPQIPALCHMTESAQRRWVATYQRDNRSLEREIAKQEASAKEKAPLMADAIGHHHHE